MKSSVIAGGSGSFKRNKFDFYFTPKEATIALMSFLSLPNDYTLLEPACGEGHIVTELQRLNYSVIANDIRQNSFGTSLDYLSAAFHADAIITNPPFNLAEEFIIKAVTEASVTAMLLKAHFWHTKKRYALFSETKPAYVLPLTWRPNMSPDRGSSPTMDFQWTVWLKHQKSECKYFPLSKPLQS